MKKPTIKKTANKKVANPPTWTVPQSRCVSINEARANLSRIIASIEATGKGVDIGADADTSLSAFISLKEYEKDKRSGAFPYSEHEESIDIDALRKSWSATRQMVENTGKARLIHRRNKIVAVLVAGATAFDTRIEKNRASLADEIREKVRKEELFCALDQLIPKMDIISRQNKHLKCQNDLLKSSLEKTISKIDMLLETLPDADRLDERLSALERNIKETYTAVSHLSKSVT